jgi:predicted phosphoribosyltransferase
MFRDRKDAAIRLAHALEKYRNTNALVLGIPRGGVETAYYVASYLNTEMSLVVSRKLGYRANPEAAFGAIAEDGSIYMAPTMRKEVSEAEVHHVLGEQKQEMQRRVQELRRGKPLPDMKDRTVILVDDGIATGATLIAAIDLCKNRGAGKIVVAAPIAGPRMEVLLSEMVDEVFILEAPEFYVAVSQGYEYFPSVEDEEVLAFMDKRERERRVQIE